MNIKVTSITDWNFLGNDTYTANRVYVSDYQGLYKPKDIKVENLLCGFVSKKGIKTLAIFKIISIGKVLSNRINNVTFKRLNKKNEEENLPLTNNMFICSVEDYVYDIPNDNSASINNDLLQRTLIYNLSHMPKTHLETIKTEDIITEEIEGIEKHYIDLEFEPIIENNIQVSINGIDIYINEDFIIEEKRMFLDTDKEDGFNFKDWQEANEQIKITYRFLPQ